MRQFLFISSMSRSGSTLLDKLLGSHQQLSVLEQPFPLLFTELKRQFYQQIQHPESYYLLNNYSSETRYTIEQLNDFLNNTQLSANDLQAIFQKMKNYSGQRTKWPQWHSIASQFEGGSTAHAIQFLLEAAAYRRQPAYFGSKEVFCEEFFSYLLQNQFKVIAIIRDPRDVVVSLNYGNRKTFTGDLRPLLFNLRNWRKSAAFILMHLQHPNFHYLRYEDLVQQPETELKKITSFLNIKNFDMQQFAQGIPDQQGQLWKGNSSHGKKTAFSGTSVARYKNTLPPEVQQYIENVCWPEMKFFHYSTKNTTFTHTVMRQFVEPYKIERTGFEQNYSSAQQQVATEKQRFELLKTSDIPHNLIQQFFITENVFRQLQQLAN